MKHVIPSNVIDAAQKAERKWKICASISLAQWALESGYGAHAPGNNPFGIKAVAGQPFIALRSREVAPDGHEYFQISNFRKFASIDEAFDLHGKLLACGKPYQAFKSLAMTDPIAYCHKLTLVYASDPTYGHVLEQIIEQNDLTQYDHKTELPAIVVASTTAVATATAAVVKAVPVHTLQIDWQLLAVGATGLTLGFGFALLWASILAYRQIKYEPLDIEQPEGLEEIEMAVRSEAQPLIDQITALVAKANSSNALQGQLDAANANIQDLQNQLAAAKQNDVDTDAAMAQALNPQPS